MQDLDVEPPLAATPGDLEQAAGIAGDHGPSPGCGNALDLAFAQTTGHVGLEQIVDAGTATAELALPELSQVEPGDATEEGTRLVFDSLAVNQVAGVVVRHCRL